MTRTHHDGDDDPCPIVSAVEAIAGRWKGAILRPLQSGPQRFGELRRQLGTISPKVLTQQLRQLERDGLITREQFAEIPPRVEYSLTPLCRSVLPILDSISDWWRVHGSEVEAARLRHDANALDRNANT